MWKEVGGKRQEDRRCSCSSRDHRDGGWLEAVGGREGRRRVQTAVSPAVLSPGTRHWDQRH